MALPVYEGKNDVFKNFLVQFADSGTLGTIFV